jgi:hypothetical protein
MAAPLLLNLLGDSQDFYRSFPTLFQYLLWNFERLFILKEHRLIHQRREGRLR